MLAPDDTRASRPRELPLSQSTRKRACAHATLQAVLRLGCDWLEASSRDSPATRLPAFPRKRLQTVSPWSQQIPAPNERDLQGCPGSTVPGEPVGQFPNTAGREIAVPEARRLYSCPAPTVRGSRLGLAGRGGPVQLLKALLGKADTVALTLRVVTASARGGLARDAFQDGGGRGRTSGPRASAARTSRGPRRP